MNALEVDNLRVAFPGKNGVIKAVEGVSLTVGKGECTAIVGESGCGKSVTSLAIMKLLPDNAACAVDRLSVAGEDITGYSGRQMQDIRGNRVSIIFQDALGALNPVMPIGRQVDEVFITHMKLSKKEAKARTIEALTSVGIPDAARRYKDMPHELSGGMRQRTLIAMAFACRPELIIADEPTTALDVTIQAQVLELLKRLQKENGTALLLITHDLGVVRRMADKVCVMYSGKIVEEADSEVLFGEPRHPYTKGLMASAEGIADESGAFVQIPGTLPDPAAKPAGCYFCPRCSECSPRCESERPVLLQKDKGRYLRCFNE